MQLVSWALSKSCVCVRMPSTSLPGPKSQLQEPHEWPGNVKNIYMCPVLCHEMSVEGIPDPSLNPVRL